MYLSMALMEEQRPFGWGCAARAPSFAPFLHRARSVVIEKPE